MARHIVVNRFGVDPDVAFSEAVGGPLVGWDVDAVGPEGYESERGKRLYDALDVPLSDEEYQLGELPDGCWALVGLTVEGYRFAREEERDE